VSNLSDTRILEKTSMSFSTAGRDLLKAEMNVTPMIDILLVLIIVFMVVVVSSFQPKGLQAQIPQPAADASPQPRTIVIQLSSSGDELSPQLTINDEKVTWLQLPKRLFDIFKQRAERVAFVKGNGDVDFRYFAEVIDIARGAGIERVGLLGKTPDTR